MKTILKGAAALALGMALVASAVTESSARSWRPWAAAGAGFIAGAAIAGAAANNGYYYGPGYGYYEPGYGYGNSGYAYEPGYSSGYAYGPAYPSYGYSYGRNRNCHQTMDCPTNN